MSKLGLSLVVMLALLLTPMVAAYADFKVGIVDSADIVFKSAEGKRVQENIKRKSEELSRPFAQRQQDLQRQVQEFEKQQSVMKEDARKRRAEELQKKMQEFQQQYGSAEKQLSEFQQKEIAPINQKLESAVKAVAAEMKLDIVLDKRNSGLLYMNPSLDITDKVRGRFGQ